MDQIKIIKVSQKLKLKKKNVCLKKKKVFLKNRLHFPLKRIVRKTCFYEYILFKHNTIFLNKRCIKDRITYKSIYKLENINLFSKRFISFLEIFQKNSLKIFIYYILNKLQNLLKKINFFFYFFLSSINDNFSFSTFKLKLRNKIITILKISYEKLLIIDKFEIKIRFLKFLKNLILILLVFKKLDKYKKRKIYLSKLRVKKNKSIKNVLNKIFLLDKVQKVIFSLNFKNTKKIVRSDRKKKIVLFILRIFLEFIPLIYSRIYLSGLRMFFIITMISFYLYAFLIYFET